MILPAFTPPGVLKVFSDLEALSRAAAALVVEQAKAALAARGRVLLALSGGGTPARTYELLGSPPLREAVAWERMHLFFGDERCVPPDDRRSNYRLVRERLVEQVSLPPEQVHAIFCLGDPEAAARGYEELLRRELGEGQPGFDMALLGLGADGHTASLFPGQEPPPEAWVVPVKRAQEEFFRVTLTPTVLNRTRLVVFLVSGPEKAQALKAVLEGGPVALPPPARLIRPAAGEVYWLADRPAAGLLTSVGLAEEGRRG